MMSVLKVLLTMVVRTGMTSRAQSLSTHVGIGSSSKDLTGDTSKVLQFKFQWLAQMQ